MICAKISKMSLLKGTVTPKNIQNICKICLEEKNDLLSFDSIVKLQDTNIASISIADILTKVILQVDTTENCHPKVMCYECLNELTIAYIFVLKYQESDQVLKQFLSNPSKEESNECEEEKKSPKSLKNGTRRPDEDFDDDETSILHPCPICTKTFKALELRDHAHTHKALKKYLNIPSDQKVSPRTRFSTKRHLESLQETIFKKPEKKHKCPYCNFECTVDEFWVHIDAHDGTRNEFRCDKCGKTFKKLRCLNNHRVVHLKEFPHKCETCGKGFVIKRNYDYHILTHRSDESPLECRYCLRKFTNPRNHRRHSKIHAKNVTYRCYYCRQTLTDQDQLKRHVCVPNEKSPPKTCQKVYKQSNGLPRTLCAVCGKHVVNIKYHTMSHTGEKPFQCNLCEKRFISKPLLKQHLLVHSGLKPYVCSVCAKAFNNLYNLQVHERIHKGDRRHICSVCNKGFLEKSYLKKHIMNVHLKL